MARCGAERTFQIQTSAGDLTADQVIVATGGYHDPFVPEASVRYTVSVQVAFVREARQTLAPLFNIVGSELDAGKVRTTYGWVIGGSLVVPPGKTTVTAVARVTDNAGKSGSTTSTFGISKVVNGQELTPGQ